MSRARTLTLPDGTRGAASRSRPSRSTACSRASTSSATCSPASARSRPTSAAHEGADRRPARRRHRPGGHRRGRALPAARIGAALRARVRARASCPSAARRSMPRRAAAASAPSAPAAAPMRCCSGPSAARSGRRPRRRGAPRAGPAAAAPRARRLREPAPGARAPGARGRLDPASPRWCDGVDLVFVRELTGGIYFGEKRRDATRAPATCASTRVAEIERIVRVAARLARTRRRRLTSIDKANVLETSRLWREVAHARSCARNFPTCALEHMLVDSAAMHLIRRPRDFDVLVTENMFGDILTDEASMLAGSLGPAALGLPRRGHARHLRADPRLGPGHRRARHRQSLRRRS